MATMTKSRKPPAGKTRTSPAKKARPAAAEKASKAAVPKLIVPGYAHFGGKHHETAHLRNILTHLGVVSPHTGKPYTEEILLGIGGGIGFGYFLYEVCGGTFLAVGGRHVWGSTKAEFMQGICGRLGCRVTTKEAGGQRAATENLHEALERGRPAVVWVGQAGLPWHALSLEWLKGYMYCVVVYGYDEKADRYLVGDRSRRPATISSKDLAVARPAIVSLRSRTLVIDPPSRPPDLRKAVKDGIQACVISMTKPPIANYGLAGIAKWADLVANPKDAKGWPRVLSAGRPLYDALARVYQYLEVEGAGGGAFRSMYADFLDEASDLLDTASLRDVARLYREAAAAWTDLAEAALPDDVPLFARTRALMIEKARLFEVKGEEAIPEMTRLREQLEDLARVSKESFPLDEAGVEAHRAGMRRRLEELHRMETGAIEALRAAVLV